MASIQFKDISEFRGPEGLNSLVADVNKLVSLPDIYYRLESALESPTSTISDFANLLSSDPDLCARLLRMANSAFYSFPSKIETIDRAISTIGMRQIRELVLVTSVIEMFEGVSIPLVNMRSFWEHSVAVGVFSRSIAQYSGLGQSERFYIPGLLHDIGRLVLFLKLPGFISELLQQSVIESKSLFLLEQEQLGYNHGAIGGQLLEFWKVPRSIYEPVSYHHEPEASPEFSQLSCVIHISDAWINRQKIGSSGESNPPVIRQSALDMISIQEDELEEIWVSAKDQVFGVINQFLSH
ncbi:MAG: HDOD domain-containing protein [Gammaproteobacteria bacterium]|nr:HDOD domain-containing protein [Gammaproteobacteria bacterium]